MDHNGFLRLTRQVHAATQEIARLRAETPGHWEWKYMTLPFPESKCPYCNEVIRSNSIWFINQAVTRLIGIMQVKPGMKAVLQPPRHPHIMDSVGTLCLGRNRDVVSLIASPPNLLDCPMGIQHVPRWLITYWDHRCAIMMNHIRDYVRRGILSPDDADELLQEDGE